MSWYCFCRQQSLPIYAKPTDDHWAAVKRILRYLKFTIYHGILIRPSPQFVLSAFSYAVWVDCPNNRRSTSGYCIYLGPNLISWSSRKQHTVSRSSTESEHRGLANAIAEVIWIQSLLRELGLQTSSPPILWCDNIGATYLTINPVFHMRTKYIEIDFHFVREKVAQKSCDVRFISSKDQAADVFTKGLLFQFLRDKLTVQEEPLSLRGSNKPRWSNLHKNGKWVSLYPSWYDTIMVRACDETIPQQSPIVGSMHIQHVYYY